MTNAMTTKSNITYDFKTAVEQILEELRRDRDRQIIARRFGFGLRRRQTLEKIGSDFEITRERVRQIEKAAIAKMRSSDSAEIAAASELLRAIASDQGGIMPIADVAEILSAPEIDAPYIVFLALLSPSIELIADDDDLRGAIGLTGVFSQSQITQLLAEIIKTV